MTGHVRTMRPDARESASQAVPDMTMVVRGGSRGFTVLLLGGAVQPLVGVLFDPLGYVWLVLVAVCAFAWAAWPRRAARAMSRGDGALVGSTAALCSYLLILPLVISAAGFVPWSQVIFTSLTAVAVGAAVGGLAPRAVEHAR